MGRWYQKIKVHSRLSFDLWLFCVVRECTFLAFISKPVLIHVQYDDLYSPDIQQRKIESEGIQTLDQKDKQVDSIPFQQPPFVD